MQHPVLAAVVYAKLDHLDTITSAELRDEVTRRGETMLHNSATQWGGTVVKRLGDGALVRFGRASDAIVGAIAMAQRLERDKRTHGEASVGTASIGIGVGEITESAEDIHGLSVVSAARLAASGGEGQILCAPLVPELIYPSSGFSFEPLSAIPLKGFEEPVAPVRVTWEQYPDLAARVGLPAALKGQNFVGRHDERSRIQELVETSKRSASFVTISGVPGVGKTALAGQVASSLRGAGALILFGANRPEGSSPFQCYREALDDFAGRHPRGVNVLSAHIDALGAILEPATTDAIGDDRSETRLAALYETVADLFAQLCQEAPVVLVLDDIQWLDRASTSLTRHLLAHLSDQPFSILATARPQELNDADHVTHLLSTVARSTKSDLIELSGLGPDDLAGWVGSRTDTNLIFERTGGNPFLVVEMLSSSLDAESSVSWRAQSAVSSRLGRLSEGALDTLKVAAVHGREFPPRLVTSCATADDEIAFDHLDEAIATGVLREVKGRTLQLQFDHDLLRESVLESLSEMRKARIHQRLGQTMADGATPDVYGDVARHFAEAAILGASDEACRFHLLAGEHALNVSAFDDAIDWFERAAALATTSTDSIRADIGRGRSLRANGDPTAREAFHRASDAASRSKEPELMAEALLADYRGTFGIAFKVDEDRVSRLRAALALLSPAPSKTRARVLAALAVELVWAPEWTEAIELADASLEAIPPGDTATRAEVLALRQWVIYHPTSVRQAETEELRTIINQSGDVERQFEIAGHAVFTSIRAADPRGARAAIDLARWYAERIDQPLTEWMLAQRESCLAMVESRLDDALAWIDRASVLGTESNQPDATLMYVVQTFWLSYETEEPAAQREELLEAFATVEFWPKLSWPSVAFRCHEAGLASESLDVYNRLAAVNDFAFPRDQIWLWTMCQLAPIAAANDSARVRFFIDALEEHRDEFANMVFSSVGPVARALGLLQAADGNTEQALEDLRLAVEICDRMGATGWAARCRLDLADLVSGEEAAGLRNRAGLDAETIGLPLVVARAGDGL